MAIIERRDGLDKWWDARCPYCEWQHASQSKHIAAEARIAHIRSSHPKLDYR